MHSIQNSNIDAQLVSAEFISNPYPLLRRLREEEPIYWSDAIGGWIMTRYDDIVVSFKQTGRFSNENRLGQALLYLPPESARTTDPLPTTTRPRACSIRIRRTIHACARW